jgi:hypothetical protein
LPAAAVLVLDVAVVVAPEDIFTIPMFPMLRDLPQQLQLEQVVPQVTTMHQ